MTTANPQHARLGAIAHGWRAFRRWRRARPFWGGVFTTLAGLEIFATTQMSLGGLSFQMGPTGYLSWLIPTVLVACGMLMWFTPQQRMFYAIVGSMTALFSLIGVNLGGFFIGLLLGVVGGALGFAWTPLRPAPAVDGIEGVDGPGASEPPADGDLDPYGDRERGVDTTLDQTLTGPLSDMIPAPRNPLHEPVHREQPEHEQPEHEQAEHEQAEHEQAEHEQAEHEQAEHEQEPTRQQGNEAAGQVPSPHPADSRGEDQRPPGYQEPLPRRSSPPFVVMLILLSLSAVGAVVVPGESPAYADPCKPAPTASASRAAPADTAPTATAPTDRPAPAEAAGEDVAGEEAAGEEAAREEVAGEEPDGNLLTDIIDGVKSVLGLDKNAAGPEPSTTPTAAQPTPTATAAQPTPSPTETKPGQAEPTSKPDPCASDPGEKLKTLAADPDQPRVAKVPSPLTGSKLTMHGLKIDGIVDLPTEDGTIKVLQFSMRKAVTEDFKLRVAAPGGKTLLIETDALTVQGDVKFYATSFVGRILGLKLTLTPGSPLPRGGIPITLPLIAFDDPEIQLVFVKCHTLTGSPTLMESFVS